MRKGRESLTAQAVAFARALASGTPAALIDPHDAMAERMLPPPLARAAHGLRAIAAGAPIGGALLAGASLGLVDHVALRSAMIDRMLADALRSGVRQVVILGAGLDTRAHRLPALRDAVVYEVDHPDGQRVKRERARGLTRIAAGLRYVGVDFSAGDLRAQLAAAGHAQTERTFWLAEGLVPYLRRADVVDMLERIATASAPGSDLLVSYVTPELVWLKHARPLFLGALRLIGEPLHSAFPQNEIAALMQDAGFSVAHDSDTRDWAHALCPDATRAPRVRYERIARARR
jgi:methyltransferase (TIGR00027 family)